jgi:chromate reductase
MVDNRLSVGGIIGSLRKQSYNRGLFEAARELAPPGMNLHELPIADLPLYNEDVERAGDPEPVRAFKAGIAVADALIFFTPQYNYSIPGVLKNAIDWASRPSGQGVILGKPATVMGASSGRSGTMFAQIHLRQIFVTLNIPDLKKPELYLPYCGDKYDQSGRLIDEAVREQIAQQLVAFQEWVERLRGRTTSTR